ncbi:MAG: tRNA (adenosine(37)-N6)-dimethylallyltransferase MiaA [Thermodesulfobacteriota bacterium]
MDTDTPDITAPVLALVGPTAIGKTALSLWLAERFSCEIVGLDSMQIYRHMDIGTAKPTRAERAVVPHHLIDVVDPAEEYHVGRYVEEATVACREIIGRGHVPMLVGGTGLYLRGVLDGLFEIAPAEAGVRQELKQRLDQEGRAALHAELALVDPESAQRIHPNDTQRLLRGLEIFLQTGQPWSALLGQQRGRRRFARVLRIGLGCERELLYQRINLRVEKMMEEGLLAEVEGLLAMGYDPGLPAMQAIGYRHMVNVLRGAWPLEEALTLLARDTRRYAKRQLTWFGADREMRWFEPGDRQAIMGLIEEFFASATKYQGEPR